jgi:hypothetical protein
MSRSRDEQTAVVVEAELARQLPRAEEQACATPHLVRYASYLVRVYVSSRSFSVPLIRG